MMSRQLGEAWRCGEETLVLLDTATNDAQLPVYLL